MRRSARLDDLRGERPAASAMTSHLKAAREPAPARLLEARPAAWTYAPRPNAEAATSTATPSRRPGARSPREPEARAADRGRRGAWSLLGPDDGLLAADAGARSFALRRSRGGDIVWVSMSERRTAVMAGLFSSARPCAVSCPAGASCAASASRSFAALAATLRAASMTFDSLAKKCSAPCLMARAFLMPRPVLIASLSSSSRRMSSTVL